MRTGQNETQRNQKFQNIISEDEQTWNRRGDPTVLEILTILKLS